MLQTADFAPALLCGSSRQAVLRMGIGVTRENLCRVDGGGLVQADTEGLRRFDALQDVHVVGQRRWLCGGAAEAVVPAGPGQFAGGQQARVGVQHHVVVGIAQVAENLALAQARFSQQTQGLVAVTGKDHFVEKLAAGGAEHRHAIRLALDPLHRAVQANTFGEALRQRRHVGTGAALDHSPLRAIGDRQQAVVSEEAHKELQRKTEHVGQ